jgi:hypothetical protein
MAYEDEMQDKYMVIKYEDAQVHLSVEEKSLLAKMFTKVAEGRKYQGKKLTNTYVVVNTDEPYIADVVDVLKRNGHWG